MTFKSMLCAGTAAIAITGPTTAEAGGYYLTVFGGIATFDDTFEQSASKYVGYANTVAGSKYSSTVTHIYQRKYTASWRSGFDSGGWAIGAAVGFDLANNVRTELEWAYRGFDIEEKAWVDAYANIWSGTFWHTGSFIGSSSTQVSTRLRLDTDGDLTSWSLMANLWYDISLPNTKLTPFIGGGIGVAKVSLDYGAQVAATFMTYSGATYSLTFKTGFDESEWTTAYQFGAGASYELSNGLVLSAQYRYFATTDVDIAGIDMQLDSHDFLFGVRVAF